MSGRYTVFPVYELVRFTAIIHPEFLHFFREVAAKI
jgi:hypothetical protein